MQSIDFECEFCSSKIKYKSNLLRQKKDKHHDEMGMPWYTCSECKTKYKTVKDLETHFQSHSQRLENLCPYCQTGFSKKQSFAAHIEDTHGLPVWNSISHEHILAPQQSAFSGALQIFSFPGNDGDIDLLEFLFKRKEPILNLIKSEAQYGAKKVQLVSVLDLYKRPANDEDEEKQTRIYAQTEMESVDCDGLTDESFVGMVDKMLSVLFVFASEGSGWILRQVNETLVKLAAVASVQGSSFLPLPHFLQGKSFVLNIRNHSDHSCFQYCYTAAYHKFHGPPIAPECFSLYEQGNVALYDDTNPDAHKPVGNFIMPMALSAMTSFEKQNEVQINVFR